MRTGYAPGVLSHINSGGEATRSTSGSPRAPKTLVTIRPLACHIFHASTLVIQSTYSNIVLVKLNGRISGKVLEDGAARVMQVASFKSRCSTARQSPRANGPTAYGLGLWGLELQYEIQEVLASYLALPEDCLI